MSLREKLLYHQIHPLKITIDVLFTFVGLYFYWQHQFVPGLVATFVPSLIVSGLVLYFADLKWLSESRFGGYVQKNMTRTLETIRFLTNFVMLSGAWYHLWYVVALGVLIILGCWCWGLILDVL